MVPVCEITEDSKTSPDLRLTRQDCCLCEAGHSVLEAHGKDFEYGTSDDEFHVVRCLTCGLLYLDPRPDVSELDRIYPSTYHAFQFSSENFGLAYRVRCRLEARRLLSACKGLKAGAKILDVGCGDGFHLRLLKEFGHPSWRLQGIDTSDRAVTAARRAGLDVLQVSIQEAGLPTGSFDLVFLLATIEHVSDPVAVLNAVSRLLTPGGRVVIVTDNTATLDRWIFGARHWGGYHFPRHWNLFERKTLQRLASKVSLEVVNIETIVSPVNWVYSIRNWLQDRGAPHWLYDSFSLKSALPLAVFTLIDLGFQIAGHGALLRATLRRSS